MGDGAGTDALRGLAVCFIAGTASSLHTPLPAPSRAPWPPPSHASLPPPHHAPLPHRHGLEPPRGAHHPQDRGRRGRAALRPARVRPPHRRLRGGRAGRRRQADGGRQGGRERRRLTALQSDARMLTVRHVCAEVTARAQTQLRAPRSPCRCTLMAMDHACALHVDIYHVFLRKYTYVV